jgi:hypothetical protein
VILRVHELDSEETNEVLVALFPALESYGWAFLSSCIGRYADHLESNLPEITPSCRFLRARCVRQCLVFENIQLAVKAHGGRELIAWPFRRLNQRTSNMQARTIVE